MEDGQHARPSTDDIRGLLNNRNSRRQGIGAPSKRGVFGPLSEMHAGVLKSSMRPMHRSGSDGRRTSAAVTGTTNRTINLPARSFSFRQRRGKLDTRAIAQIDLNRVVRETDIDTIQNQLENLAFSDITLQDFNQYSDEYFLKLFQIAQLTVEYLLNVQESLVVHAEELESQCDQIQHECAVLAEENESVDAELRHLKQEIKQKQNTISTYELMLLTRQHQTMPPSQGSTLPTTSPSGPVECILCNKRFLSTEYLLKHQRNKHVHAAAEAQSTKPPLIVQVEAKEPVESPPPPPTPQPTDLTVVNALISANTAVLTKQIEAIQVQLAHDKTERAQETQLLTHQHQSFAEKMVEHLARMQEALKDMHVQSQAQREEWAHFAQDLMQKTTEKMAKTATHIGPILNDGAEEQWRREILQELKTQKEEEKQRRLELEAERKRWTEREAELQAKLNDQQQLPTLTQLVAMEAHRYGIDYGLASSPRATTQEDRSVMRTSQIIQTDRDVRDSQQQTDDVPVKSVVSSAAAPQQTPTPIVQPKAVATSVEANPVTPMEPLLPPQSIAPPPVAAVGEQVLQLPSPVLPPPEQLPVEMPARLDLHRAATTVQRVAAGFVTRKQLGTPENWVLRYGSDIHIDVTRHMTANALRRIVADKLGGIDPQRVLVHDSSTGSELVGDVFVFHTNGHLDIEVVREDYDPFVDDLVRQYHTRTSQIQSLRDTAPRTDLSATDVASSIVKLQAVVRGVLGRRQATELRIDRLVDLRLKQLHESPVVEHDGVPILHHPRDSSPALQQEAVKVHARLVKAMSDFHGRPAAPLQSMSQVAFDAAMKNVDEARKKYPAPMQSRIAVILGAIHTAAMQHYDPDQAKVLDDRTAAAVSIQSMVRVGLAKKVVAQLAKKATSDGSSAKLDKDDESDDVADAKETAADSKRRLDSRPPDDGGAKAIDEEKTLTRSANDDDDDDAVTIDEFNELETAAPRRSDARHYDEYDEEKAQFRALQDIQDDDDAKSARISPHSNTPLKSMHRRNSRGSMLHNAR
ncbi:hypothetical protein H310_05215 [Aphanomyces invadans]|uniref:C2H2-type domain-containing protein n=1 Tax=Aphanomyces invadans TaxID=157072 RepID=A0A024UCD6_9STRA|nr:hypothetical protein H310_05215 [Aphanomyces invadans]ETW03865.1 hypothetical protein H310_05215 [Aphanomyces invadans]|eukprot:XP_008868094.1 hypothetical protein H310_05215 [Aphanomyces invadans]